MAPPPPPPLPPLAPPPKFRPPSVPIAHTTLTHTTNTVANDASNGTIPQEIESKSGFNQAQPVTTKVAPTSELNRSDLSRTTADEALTISHKNTVEQKRELKTVSSHQQTQNAHVAIETKSNNETKGITQANDHAQFTNGQNDVVPIVEDSIPVFSLSLNQGRPKHPTLPIDPELIPKQGEGLNDKMYE